MIQAADDAPQLGKHEIVAEGCDGEVHRIYVRDAAILHRRRSGIRLIDMLGNVEVVVVNNLPPLPVGAKRQFYSSALKPIAVRPG